jgi:hypothetical protein
MPLTEEDYLNRYYTIAASLEDSEWVTTSYEELETCVKALAAAGSAEAALNSLSSLRELMETSLLEYLSTPVYADEVTAETRAGHHLVEDGLNGWLEAIEMAVASQGKLESLCRALELAEHSNRILISMQRFEADLLDKVAKEDPNLHLLDTWSVSAMTSPPFEESI